MGFIYGADRHAEILFPERLDDSMAAVHPVRFLDAFVDHLDLAALGFQRAYNLRRVLNLVEMLRLLAALG